MKPIFRILGLLLAVEGALMLLCGLVGLAMHDRTSLTMLPPALFTAAVGLLLCMLFNKNRAIADKRMAYLGVVLFWIALAAFGMLPFLTSHSLGTVADAAFESMSGFASAGATVFQTVAALPPSILLWRSLSQWVGGFGIILLVLAIVPTLGINKYSLYTAEASGADNTGKLTTSMADTIRQTLSVYLCLTLLFIVLLWVDGLTLWQAVNTTFTHISSGGFSIFDDGIASLSHSQQLILLAAMLLSGVNFAFLYHLFTLKIKMLRNKLDQISFYLLLNAAAIVFTSLALHYRMDYGWGDAWRCGAVQSVSVVTTTGTQIADTRLWWPPVTFLFLLLSLCGGMAGSTSGGLKAMRVLILLRNVRNALRNRLHPNAVNPVRLNKKPVSQELITNVMVIFFIYLFTLAVAIFVFLLCGVDATEGIGAAVGCLSGYGPGLGNCGGFGSYAHLAPLVKWVCTTLMLLGRLECLAVYMLLFPAFWRR